MYLQSLAVREERPLVEKIRTRQVQSQERQPRDLNCVRCRQEVQEEGEESSRPLPRCGDEGFTLSGQETHSRKMLETETDFI